MVGAYLTIRSLDRRLKQAAKFEGLFLMAGQLVTHSVSSEVGLPEDDVPFTEAVATEETLPRIIRQAVDAIRAEIGWVREDSLGANRLVVERCFRKFAEGRGMRKSHIARFAGMVAEIYFLPTVDDMLAKAVRAHPLAAEARQSYAEVAVPESGWELRLYAAGAGALRSALTFGTEAVLERIALAQADVGPRAEAVGVRAENAPPVGPGREAAVNPV